MSQGLQQAGRLTYVLSEYVNVHGRRDRVVAAALETAVIRRGGRCLAPVNGDGIRDVLDFDEGTTCGCGVVGLREGYGIGQEETILVIRAATLCCSYKDDFGVLRPGILGIVESGQVREGHSEAVIAAAYV